MRLRQEHFIIIVVVIVVNDIIGVSVVVVIVVLRCRCLEDRSAHPAAQKHIKSAP